jgi:hypothetical protein
VGINLIVLDDGWFGKRESDAGSLGDWVADLRKFPQGIKGLAEDVNAAGCKFGIWFEPEMVSEKSVRLFTSSKFVPPLCTDGSAPAYPVCGVDSWVLLCCLVLM